MAHASLGPTLVTGGCGFLGSHIVRELLKEPVYEPVVVVSRDPSSNLFDRVEYRSCDLVEEAKLLALLQEIKPRTVFYAASPTSADFNTPMQYFFQGNVHGTNNLLSGLKKVGSAKILVYSSTVSVIEGGSHELAPETTPYWQKMGGDCLPYYWSKTIAEQNVLNANENDHGLRTVALRLCLMYGPGDRQCVPNLIDAVKGGQSNIQLGDNTNKIDILSVIGAANAHILAARLLHDPNRATGKIDGEAFNITDGQPIKFWDFMRLVYRLAGDTTKSENVKIIPAWLAVALADTAESIYYLLTLGTRRPTQLNRTIVTHAVRTYTYDISKARLILGYEPAHRLEEGIRESIIYEFKRRGEAPPASAT